MSILDKIKKGVGEYTAGKKADKVAYETELKIAEGKARKKWAVKKAKEYAAKRYDTKKKKSKRFGGPNLNALIGTPKRKKRRRKSNLGLFDY